MASSAPTSSQSGVADENSLVQFYHTFRKFLNVDSAFNESHKRRLQSNRAQQKLLRLSAQQFHELSTDVYDELLRRTASDGSSSSEFLTPLDNFHPKRNQARQKLSLLSPSRFNDLSFDILFEIERRLKLHPTPTAQEAVRNPIAAFNSPTQSIISTQSTATQNSQVPQNAQPSQSAPYGIKTAILPEPNRGSLAPSLNSVSSNPHASFASLDYNTPTSVTAPIIVPAAFSSQSPNSLSQASHSSPTAPASSSPSTHRGQLGASPDKSYPQLAPPPYDTSDPKKFEEPTPQYIQPTTKTITPEISDLVEEDDSDSSSEQNNDEDEVYSEVGDQEASNDPLNSDMPQDMIDAAARAWASKNSSHADLTKLNSATNLDQINDNAFSSQSPDNDGEHHFQDQALASPGFQENFDQYGPLGLHSIAEEKSPYIPPNILANGSFGSTGSDGKRLSLSEQISSSIIRSSSASKIDLEAVNSQRSLSVQNDAQRAESQKQITDLQAEVSRLQNQLNDQNKQIKNLVDEGTRLDANISKLEHQLQESESLKESLVEENGRLHQMISDVESGKDQQDTQISILRIELDKKTQELEEKHQLVERHKNELDDTSREFGMKTEQYINDLEEKHQAMQSLEQQHAKLKEKYNDVMNKQNEYAGSSASLSSKIMLLEGQLIQKENVSICIFLFFFFLSNNFF